MNVDNIAAPLKRFGVSIRWGGLRWTRRVNELIEKRGRLFILFFFFLSFFRLFGQDLFSSQLVMYALFTSAQSPFSQTSFLSPFLSAFWIYKWPVPTEVFITTGSSRITPGLLYYIIPFFSFFFRFLSYKRITAV